MIQAESIMEQIGYFQKLEYNQKQIETEKSTKAQSISKPATQQSKPAEELKPFETDEYILSADKETLQKGKDVGIIHIPLGVERIKDKAFESLNHIK